MAAGGMAYAALTEGGLFWVVFEGVLLGLVGWTAAVVVVNKESIPERIGIGACVGLVLGALTSITYGAIALGVQEALGVEEQAQLISPIVQVLLLGLVGAVAGIVAGAITGLLVSLLSYFRNKCHNPQ
jgi:hypothetical protein